MSDRKQPIFDTEFWRKRLAEAPDDDIQKAIYWTDADTWAKIEATHKRILKSRIRRTDSVLDVGCGWGRLLTLMPMGWCGQYIGIDLSPDFIAMAKARYLKRQRQFFVADAREDLTYYMAPFLQDEEGGYTTFSQEDGSIRGVKRDWAILISIKQMVINNAGGAVWDQMQTRLKEVCNNILVLEYSIEDKGEVI